MRLAAALNWVPGIARRPKCQLQHQPSQLNLERVQAAVPHESPLVDHLLWDSASVTPGSVRCSVLYLLFELVQVGGGCPGRGWHQL